MGQIVLLRHGQASFGADDYDVLSDLGHRQAEVVAAALAGRELRDPLAVSGTLRRQIDTLSPVAAALGTGVTEPDPRWNEYDHIGLVQEFVHADSVAEVTADSTAFQRRLDEALATWVRADAPDGWAAFAGGAVAALEDLVETLGRGRDAVVATSGGVIAAVVAHVLGGGAEAVVALNRVTINAGLTTLLSGGSGLSLLAFNETAHLGTRSDGLVTFR